jgi:hypothetical protein
MERQLIDTGELTMQINRSFLVRIAGCLWSIKGSDVAKFTIVRDLRDPPSSLGPHDALEPTGVISLGSNVASILTRRRRAKILSTAVEAVRVFVIKLFRGRHAPAIPEKSVQRNLSARCPHLVTIGVERSVVWGRSGIPILFSNQSSICFVDNCEMATGQRNQERSIEVGVFDQGADCGTRLFRKRTKCSASV